MTEIRLHNTRTRRKEPFTPLDPANVRMYVCGPTVYDRAHLGNARPVVVFDVLYRLLKHLAPAKGWEHVTYVRNFTDVDDKINARARDMQVAGDGRSLNEIIRALTDETIKWYHADMDALGALRPTHEPRATEFIVQMVAMIDGLIGKGHAYAAEGHVLFDVRSYPEYGALSGRSVNDMIAGARVEVAPYKRDPMDFVLWKPSSDEEPGWDGPVWEGKSIGRGRPGWHIECSAMAQELLGPAFDIHGGGIDLQFPHHENEIAQSCCAHPEAGFANVWLHNEMVQVDGKKMSKSLGNFFTVRDLLDQGWPGEVIRFVMLSTHYRKPMDWTEEKAARARNDLRYMMNIIRFDKDLMSEATDNGNVANEIVSALSEDINTSLAITSLMSLARKADDQRNYTSDTEQLAAKRDLIASASFLGFDLIELSKKLNAETPIKDLEHYEQELAFVRADAKETKDFAKVDRLKELLTDAGVEVRMSKERVELIAGPNFDPSKLEALK